MIELVEMEVRELLSEMGFEGDDLPVIKGSALQAVEGKNDELGWRISFYSLRNLFDLNYFPFKGKDSITALLDAVDNTIPVPERMLDEPFCLCIEHVHSIVGRYAFFNMVAFSGVWILILISGEPSSPAAPKRAS